MNWLRNKFFPCQHDAFLIGYYGMQNAGDDALMLASKYIADFWLQAESVAITSANQTYSKTHNVFHCEVKRPQDFKGQNKIQQLKTALKSRHIIFGGGSVFHRYQDIEEKRWLMRLAHTDQHMAIGVSLGPFADKQSERSCANFLNECHFVGVRDKESLQIARDIAPDANVHSTFDLAPLMVLLPEFKLAAKPRHGIVVNVCPVATDSFGQLDQQQHLKQLRFWCDTLLQLWREHNEPITLIALNGHEQFGDLALCQAIQEKLAGKVAVSITPYQNDPFATIKTLSAAKLILGMRLHACVFGYLTNTPVVAVNYHAKGEAWCKQIGLFPDYRFNIRSAKSTQLAEVVSRIFSLGYQEPQLNRNEALLLAKQNWRMNHEIKQDISRYSFV